jgi:pimeloyl-ACP methyl ester carboxylesterase
MTTVKLTALIALAAFAVGRPIECQVPVLAPRVVEVDGNPVRVLTVGLNGRTSGEPVFVLQAGGGASLDSWDVGLVREIAALAPVVAYDRPGLGGSRFDGHSPSPQRVADHLTTLLGVLDVGPPYILVGHSWGGPLILYFAAQHPGDIAGLVYLDPSLPGRTLDLPTDSADRALALAQIDSLRGSLSNWPEGRRAGVLASSDYWLTPPEQRAIPPNANVPTAVLLGTLVGYNVPESERPTMRAFHERRVEETRTWMRGVDLLHFVEAPDAGHFVHRDAPNLALDAIRQVFDWAKRPR